MQELFSDLQFICLFTFSRVLLVYQFFVLNIFYLLLSEIDFTYFLSYLLTYLLTYLLRTQYSAVDVRFGFTISVLISQLDYLKILGVVGVLVVHRQLIDDLVMYLTILSLLVTLFVQLEVVSNSGKLLKNAALHGENLENSYPCLLLKQFL